MDKFEENTNIFFDKYVSNINISNDCIPWDKEIERKLFFERVKEANKITIYENKYEQIHIIIDEEWEYYMYGYRLYIRDNIKYMLNLNEYSDIIEFRHDYSYLKELPENLKILIIYDFKSLDDEVLNKSNVNTIQINDLYGIYKLNYICDPENQHINYIINSLDDDHYLIMIFTTIKTLIVKSTNGFQKEEFLNKLIEVFPNLERISFKENVEEKTITFFEENGIEVV